MKEYFNSNIIPELLKTFKVHEVIISGIKDENLINNIFSYDATFIQINTNDDDCINGKPLDSLLNLKNYDAIFIDDDSNWYTVFNELKIIKETNDEFPLVFICNNNFPNKRRDSYSNPDDIPSNFRQKYANNLPVHYNNEKIVINDGFYHACEENTPKNGVLTAIEDFLADNAYVGMLNINFMKEICVLYPKSQINQKRISIIVKNMQSDNINDINISDKLIENQLLISYIKKYLLYTENLNDFEVEMTKKDDIIDGYENEIRVLNNEMTFKETQINGFESKLSLKDSQIKNFESKLINKDKKIDNLKNQLEDKNNDLNLMNQKLKDKIIEINELTESFKDKESNYDDRINSLNEAFNHKEIEYNNRINSLNEAFNHKEIEYNEQIATLNNEINQKNKSLKNHEDEYKNQIFIKDCQIDSLKQDFEEKEVKFNNEINSKNKNIQQKENQLKIKQQKLNEKDKRLLFLEQNYMKQLSKIDNKDYSINDFKEQISNKNMEINYLQNNSLTKKILNPFALIYLIFKSNSKEVSLNMKLYRTLKDSECFDIGFYLNKNKDLLDSKWCKYFSPELHYVCHGFKEERIFNKKYSNRNSKKELLDYLLSCNM